MHAGLHTWWYNVDCKHAGENETYDRALDVARQLGCWVDTDS